MKQAVAWLAVAALVATATVAMSHDEEKEKAEHAREAAVKGTVAIAKGTKEAAYLDLAKITAAQAIQLAVAAQPGKVFKVELEPTNGWLTWEVEIQTADHKMMAVKLDAGTGKVLLTGADDPDDHEGEGDGKDKEKDDDDDR